MTVHGSLRLIPQKKLNKAKSLREIVLSAAQQRPTPTGVHKTALTPYPTGDLFSSRGSQWRSFDLAQLYHCNSFYPIEAIGVWGFSLEYVVELRLFVVLHLHAMPSLALTYVSPCTSFKAN